MGNIRASVGDSPQQRALWLYENRTEIIEESEHDGVPCRKWTGSISSTGYNPHIKWEGKIINAVGFMRKYIGKIDQPKGTEVCHNCNTRACAEWRHVRFDTHKSNLIDLAKTGGNVNLGEKNGMAKLTSDQAREIYIRVHNGESARKLARIFSLDKSTVGDIRDRKTWRHATSGIR